MNFQLFTEVAFSNTYENSITFVNIACTCLKNQYTYTTDTDLKGRELRESDNYYKNNHRSEGIHVANARTKVIIFCKSCPLNWN